VAPQTVFVSHETYTPARGGSASAEINALRHVFGEDADKIVIANTKGFTGHAMAAGIEDVIAAGESAGNGLCTASCQLQGNRP
jgi:3-oxoacyl-(acyl-carrier-protein) synthase